MKKLKLYYLTGKEWVLEKWNGSVMDRFLVASVSFLVLFLLFILLGQL